MIQETQFLLPGYVVSNGAITGNVWSNPDNILLVDGNVTESNPGAGTASDIIIGGFNANLPQNAVITGIEMELIAYGGAQTIPPLTLTIEALDNTSGSDVYYPYTAPFSGLTQTLATYTLGTSSYLFNTAFTVDQINNLKFALIANGDIYVDSFLMKVFYYLVPTPPTPAPVQTGCVSCNSPIEVPPMYLQLPFLSGQTVFYLKAGSMVYANGQPISPSDLSACNIGEIDFTFDEGMVKGNSDNNFQEDVALDITTGFWQILPSGVVEVTLGSVNDRGLLPYQPYTHSSSFMSDHDANSKVIISNSGKFYSRFVRACQVGYVFSGPIDILYNGSDVVNPATKFNFSGAGVSVVNAGSGEANIIIPGSGVPTPTAVAIAYGTSGSVAVSSLTFSITNTGTNRANLIQISTQQSVTVSTVTVDGISASQLVTSTDAGTNIRQETWGLVAPHVGTVNVVITLSGPAFITAGAECFNSVDQSSPFGNTQNASGLTNAPTLTLTTANDNSLVVDGLATAITPILYTAGTGQTVNWAQTSNSDSRQGGSSVQAAGTAPDAVIMHYSITQVTRWCYTAVEVNGLPAAGGGGVASVTGLNTDNTDPANPVVKISVDGSSITGDGTSGSPLVAHTTATDKYVAVDSFDTTPGYLNSKLNIHSSDSSVTVTKSVTNPTENEILDYDLVVAAGVGGSQWINVQSITFSVSVSNTTITTLADFTSLAGNTDDMYMILWETSPSGGAGATPYIGLQANGDTSGDYTTHTAILGNTYTGATDSAQDAIFLGVPGQGINGFGQVTIQANSTYITNLQVQGSTVTGNGVNQQFVGIGVSGAVNPVTKLTLVAYQNSGGAITVSGKATLYKINR